jgi:hypothetical protein
VPALAAALGLAFFGERASSIAVVGGDPEPPFSAALGLAAPLGFAFFGMRASWIAVEATAVWQSANKGKIPQAQGTRLCLSY